MRNSTLTLDQAMRVFDVLGITTIQTIAAKHEGEPVKYGEVEFGQLEAGLNRLLASVPVEQREEVFLGIVRDEKRVTITIEDVIKLLIDRNGRAIPDKSVVKSGVCDANRVYHFNRLPDDYDFAVMLELWQERFKQNPGMDAKEFCERITAIRGTIAANCQIRNLDTPSAAPWFPIILPQIPLEKPEAKQMDYGKLLESNLLPAVEASYLAVYPEREFVNRCKGELEGQVTIVEPRHAQLYADLVNGPIVGILFPAALQGFSPFAQREMITLMPENFSLEGPLDGSVAETLYTRQLSRDNTPLKDYSAAQYQVSGDSLYLSAIGDEFNFRRRVALGYAYVHSTGGLFLRG